MFQQDALQQKIIKQDKVNFSQWLDRTKNNNSKKKISSEIISCVKMIQFQNKGFSL